MWGGGQRRDVGFWKERRTKMSTNCKLSLKKRDLYQTAVFKRAI